MTDQKTEVHWVSINLDDTISDAKQSFAEACCNKSFYIAEQTYHSQSWSGKTTYYKYRFYTPDGKRAYPNVGDCKVLTEITQSYNGYECLNNLLRYRRNDILYPITMSGYKGTFNTMIVRDNEGEEKEVYLSSLSALFPFLREVSRTSCWEVFKLQQVLKILEDTAESVKTSITKYGYSKREYAYQYGAFSDDPTVRERYFSNSLQRLQEAFDLIKEQTGIEHLEVEKYAIGYLKKDIDFIKEVLNRKKPWRTHSIN